MTGEQKPTVVLLRKEKEADRIASALRRIADDLENGKFGLMTTGVVVLGHTGEQECPGKDYTMPFERYTLFGLGPRHDSFTIRGLMMAAVANPDGTLMPEDEDDG